MAIRQLSSVDAFTAGDQIPIGYTAGGDDRRVSGTTLLAYLQSALTLGIPQYTTQRAAPSATGFNVAITDGSANIHLILTPAAGYAAGTITLPAVGNAVDKQLVMVNCTQAVTTLTVAGNGAVAVTGEPTTLAANAYFTLKYDAGTQTWYRVA